VSHVAAVKLVHIWVQTSTLSSRLYEHNYHVYLNTSYMVRGMQCDVLGVNCVRDIVCGCIASHA